MTQKTSKQTLLLRIYIGESDRYENKPLYRYLGEEFRKRGFLGQQFSEE
jgi:PII-like signaling protein